MTAIQRTDEATAARIREGIEKGLEGRRLESQYMREMLGTMWGSNVGQHVLMAMARYCRRHAIDPSEIDILGGKPYLNAKYYLRRLAEMGSDKIEYARADHVEHDARLAAIVGRPIPEDADEATKAMMLEERVWARREHFRRLQERITHGLSDQAPFAVVYRVKLRDVDGEFVGADEAGLKKKKTIKSKKPGGGTFQVDADPVGDENPRKTAETRAARRCLRQVVSTFPMLAQQIQVIEADGKAVVEEIVAEEQRTPQGPRPVAQLAGGEDAGPYGNPDEGPTAEVVEDGDTTDQSEPEPPKSEEERRREAPRTKAQLAQIQKVMDSEVFTDEERDQAEVYWLNATYGEMEDAVRKAKQARHDREQQAKGRAAA